MTLLYCHCVTKNPQLFYPLLVPQLQFVEESIGFAHTSFDDMFSWRYSAGHVKPLKGWRLPQNLLFPSTCSKNSQGKNPVKNGCGIISDEQMNSDGEYKEQFELCVWDSFYFYNTQNARDHDKGAWVWIQGINWTTLLFKSYKHTYIYKYCAIFLFNLSLFNFPSSLKYFLVYFTATNKTKAQRIILLLFQLKKNYSHWCKNL